MADEKQRITEFDTASQLANNDYVLVDSATLGTRKFDANSLGGVTYSAGENISISNEHVISATDTTYPDFAGSSHGLVPPATQADAGKYLKADGSWSTPGGGGRSLEDLSDVDVTDPLNGTLLYFSSIDEAWKPSAQEVESYTGGLRYIDGELYLSGYYHNYMHIENNESADSMTLGGGDIEIQGNWNEENGTSDYSSLRYAIYDLYNKSGAHDSVASLTDTTISNPTAGQVLTYDDTTSKWINAAAGGGSMPAIYSELTQVLTKGTVIVDSSDPQELPTIKLTGYGFIGLEADSSIKFGYFDGEEDPIVELTMEYLKFTTGSSYTAYNDDSISMYDRDVEVERLSINNSSITITDIDEDNTYLQVTPQDIEFSGYWGGGYWYRTKNLKDFSQVIDRAFANFADEDYHEIPLDYAHLTTAFVTQDIQVSNSESCSTLTFTGYSGIQQDAHGTIVIGFESDPNETYMQLQNDDILLGEGWVSSGFQDAQSLKAVIGDLESRISTIENNS